MQRRSVKRQPGFTLIELMISMVILLPFLAIIIWLTGEISNSQLYYVNYASATREAQFASQVIAADLDAATQIVVPSGVAPAPQLTLNTVGGSLSYSTSNGRLIRTDAQGSEYLLSTRSTVDSFTVTRAGEDLDFVTVKLGVTAASGVGGREPVTIERVVIRQMK